MAFRKTISEPFSLEGIGIHSNESAVLNFRSAESNTGIVFCRKNKPKGGFHRITASLPNVTDTSLSVTISNGVERVYTIEHLLFAIYVMEITDLIIEIQGGLEIPIMDGSALPFIEALESSGIQTFKDEIEAIKPASTTYVQNGQAGIKIKPASELTITYLLSYPHNLIGSQYTTLGYESSLFRERVASARTFGFLEEAEKLKEKGYALGGSTDNALIFTEDSTLNKPRFAQEALYHKILDLIGDIALLGKPLLGHIFAFKSGHSLNIALGRKILGLPQSA